MNIRIKQGKYQDVEAMRELYRQEVNCQIVHDSALSRGMADPYLIFVDGSAGGYGAVWNTYAKDRVMEFYTLPDTRSLALPMFHSLLEVSQATHIEAQTNIPLMLTMLYDCAEDISEQKILFQDEFITHLVCPDGEFRQATPEDSRSVFPHLHEPVGDWVIEAEGVIVATGGFYCHYNPPYGDLFMEVEEQARGRGIGSYLVQELKRRCYESGRIPAARCDPSNVASRKTLQKAGLLPCGRLLAGRAYKTR